MNLYNYCPKVYWNCACLTINAGADEEAGGSTDYVKVATAIGAMKDLGQDVELVDINKSKFGFSVNGDKILYGLKAINNIGDDVAHNIIANRPYVSFEDFLSKNKIDKRGIINLIKSGAFMSIDNPDRTITMAKYITMTLGGKTKMTLQQVPALIEKGLLKEEVDDMRRLFNFNRYLKQFKDGSDYILDKKSYDYYISLFDENKINGDRINQKEWDKQYSKAIEPLRTHLKDNYEYYINAINQEEFDAEWDKYCSGSTSAWEMGAMGFYYGEHELKNINKIKYGLCEFKDLDELAEVVGYFKIGKNQFPKYKLARISGTILGKDKTKGIIYLLSPEGKVINAKLSKEDFAMYDKQVKIDGKVVDKSFFEKGNKVLITGYRQYSNFRVKLYKEIPGEKVYLITNIDKEGNLELRSERIGD
jgi:DNA polymerase-3 subunit alpha